MSVAHSAGKTPAVVRLPDGDVPLVVGVFCDAFADYPVMRYVLTGKGKAGRTADGKADNYTPRLRELIKFFVMARSFRGEPLLGVFDGDTLSAAATLSFPVAGPGPQTTASPPEPAGMSELREKVWAELGNDARRRYSECTGAWGPLGVVVPHIHLNMIGVRPSHRGKGLARALLERVRLISTTTPGSEGVTLTTEDPANVALYEKFGYEVVGRARVADDLDTWGMFRRNSR